ncbi:hypothetical protein PCC7424_5227 [Gloeothece citriformis PCC 7424]|uniref:Uncharacterized protein n=1 Tax=Gloeothece citriformis (strain PCC 7424) TaxID=65393 RepID=B7KI88_GLOC7|nr:hypothetical protein PCC7424_5227 [Gloeothece citriformis PCC 7424]
MPTILRNYYRLNISALFTKLNITNFIYVQVLINKNIDTILDVIRRSKINNLRIIKNSLYISEIGILAIYNEKNPSKNMTFKAIVKAIANLEASGIPLGGQFIALNHWNY